MWFPVTAGAVQEVTSALINVEGADTWISFETLANRFVAFRPTALRKLWLLDDDCDQIEGDWELDLPYQGLPLEMYRAFDRLYDQPVGEEAWKEASAAILKEGPRGEAVGGDLEKWRAFVSRLAQAFDGEASESFLLSVAETYAGERLYEEDRHFRYMHHTKVCFTDGAVDEFWVDAGDLSNFALELDLETVPKMLRLAHLGLSAEPYYSTDRIAAIVMPLIDLMDAQRDEPLDD
jgi:hypothetical protein